MLQAFESKWLLDWMIDNEFALGFNQWDNFFLEEKETQVEEKVKTFVS